VSDSIHSGMLIQFNRLNVGVIWWFLDFFDGSILKRYHMDDVTVHRPVYSSSDNSTM